MPKECWMLRVKKEYQLHFLDRSPHCCLMRVRNKKRSQTWRSISSMVHGLKMRSIGRRCWGSDRRAMKEAVAEMMFGCIIGAIKIAALTGRRAVVQLRWSVTARFSAARCAAPARMAPGDRTWSGATQCMLCVNIRHVALSETALVTCLMEVRTHHSTAALA